MVYYSNMMEQSPKPEQQRIEELSFEEAMEILSNKASLAAIDFEDFPKDEIRQDLQRMVDAGMVDASLSITGLLNGLKVVYSEALNTNLEKRFNA